MILLDTGSRAADFDFRAARVRRVCPAGMGFRYKRRASYSGHRVRPDCSVTIPFITIDYNETCEDGIRRRRGRSEVSVAGARQEDGRRDQPVMGHRMGMSSRHTIASSTCRGTPTFMKSKNR